MATTPKIEPLQRTNVLLPREQVDRINELAKSAGLTQSEIIRAAISVGFNSLPRIKMEAPNDE